MKRTGPRHKKMYGLAISLGIPLPQAVGIMEMLWLLGSISSPEGDIGSLPNAAIAEGVGWTKKPDLLIDALLQNRWIDKSQKHRLIIHDWPDHCEQSVKKWLDRNGKTFLPEYGQRIANGYPPDIKKNPSREAEAKALASSGSEGGAGETMRMDWDEQYSELRKAYADSGASVADPEDFSGAWRQWTALDPAQKTDAIAWIRDRTARGEDPKFIPLPLNFITKRSWRRQAAKPVEDPMVAEARRSGLLK